MLAWKFKWATYQVARICAKHEGGISRCLHISIREPSSYDRSLQTLNDTWRATESSPQFACTHQVEHQMPCSNCLQSENSQISIEDLAWCIWQVKMASNTMSAYKKHEFHRAPNKAENRRSVQEHFNDFFVLRHCLKKRLDPLQILSSFASPLLFLKVIGRLFEVGESGEGKPCLLFWLESLFKVG